MKFQPITVKTSDEDDAPEIELLCTHRKDWPPAHARLPDTPEALRASRAIDEAKYSQLKTWEKVCGLMKMEAGKCSTCPLALYKTPTGQYANFAPDGKPKTALPPFARSKQDRSRR